MPTPSPVALLPSPSVPNQRTWHYLAQPHTFEMAPCACGNTQTQWSEFDRHLWCEVCQRDFIPSHAGIFDGPIAIQLAARLGINFDRFNMVTKKVEKFNIDSAQYDNEMT